jgi:2-polyprenyl-3-methyl-5-hydroxy-6-metoxy-1,4-benzoquinol methylase
VSQPPMECNLCHADLPARLPAKWRKDGFDIVVCPTCGLIYRRALPTHQELSKIYADTYFRHDPVDASGQGYADYLKDENAHRKTARRRLVRLERVCPPGQLLDVGCASGFFMDEARARGWVVAGIDISRVMTQWGRDKLNLHIDTGRFDQTAYPIATYDCITMWDYIEHSVDPAADFHRAQSLLKPGGILVFSTGDAGSLLARVSGRRWHLLTPRHHNFFFSMQTVQRLLERSGLRLVSARRAAAWYSTGYVAYKLRTIVPSSTAVRAIGDRIAASRFGRIVIPMNLGDVLTVTARKPSEACAPRALAQH